MQSFFVVLLNEVVLIDQVPDNALIAVLIAILATVRDCELTIATVFARLTQPVGEYVVADEVGIVSVCPVVNLNSESRLEIVRFHGFINQCTEIVAFSVILED